MLLFVIYCRYTDNTATAGIKILPRMNALHTFFRKVIGNPHFDTDIYVI